MRWLKGLPSWWNTINDSRTWFEIFKLLMLGGMRNEISRIIGLICLVDVLNWCDSLDHQQRDCVDFQNALRHDIVYFSDKTKSIRRKHDDLYPTTLVVEE